MQEDFPKVQLESHLGDSLGFQSKEALEDLSLEIPDVARRTWVEKLLYDKDRIIPEAKV